MNRVSTGEQVVVAGAGMNGCETALHLAMQGKKVTVIDILGAGEIARDASLAGRLKLMELLDQHGVVIKTETQLVEITGSAAIVIDNKKKRYKLPADTVVLSLGLKPLTASARKFHGLANEEYIIGGCLSPGNLMPAIHGGFNVASAI